MKQEVSKIEGASLVLEWEIAKATDYIDYFIVEMTSLHRKRAPKKLGKFNEIYKGSKMSLKMNDLPYNSKISCRVFAVNFRGRSEPSELFEGQTIRGIHYFNFILM